MPFINSLDFTGGVLAGGASRRMGCAKSQLTLAGEPLLRRQLRILREAGAAQLLVSQHPDRPETILLDPTVLVVTDTFPEAGPLAGLERLLAAAGYGLVLVLAVDLPRINRDFLRRLIARASPGIGVIPRVKEQLEPLAAVYPRAAQAVANAHLSRGQFALQDLARAGLAAGWLQSWALTGSDPGLLANWNRPEDFSEIASYEGSEEELRPPGECRKSEGH